MAPNRRITLTDVAREAGVSVQTASHVLAENLSVRLPQTTRDRVKLAAEKVGYRPNRLAQAMKRGKTQVIGVWMPVDRPVLNYLRFLAAINRQAHQSGYDLMITGLDGSMAYFAEGKMPYVWPVDGIIAVDAEKAMATFRADPRNDSIPIALMGYEQFKNCDSVGWDLIQASTETTRRLIAKGCKSIVHVTLDWVLERFENEDHRRIGYCQAMEEAGLSPVTITTSSESSTSAAAAVEEYLTKNPLPDAFFAFTDPLAIGAARAVTQRGFQVPNDCLIWGFGDYPESSDSRIPISTIRVPIEEVTAKAWNWLTHRIENPTEAPRVELVEMELIERESSTRP